MKHTLKLTAFFLAAVMSLSLLAGCGNANGGTEKSNAHELYFSNQEVRKSPEWVTKLDATENAEQLIVVAGVDKTTAYVTMHEKNEKGEWVETDILDETERGEGGYGHTGVK